MGTTTPVVVPRLGMTVQEVILLEWLVADGERVEAGDLLYRIETDKVETDCEAPASGVVRQTGRAGENCEVGTVIGEIIGGEG